MSDAYQLYKVTGGPAYPQTPEVNESGPTWLDQCAWHAMQGLLMGHTGGTETLTPEAIADDAYRLAKAMLAEKRRLEGEGI